MPVVKGDAGAARETADNLKKQARAIVILLGDMNRLVEKLAAQCPDDDIRQFETAVKSLNGKTMEILPAFQKTEENLRKYADILDRSLIGDRGAGILYGQHGQADCGSRPDFGVSGETLHYTDAAGKNAQIGLDHGSLEEAYGQAGSEEKKEAVRAIAELQALRATLDLQPEKSEGIQLAGPYGELKKYGNGYEAHHMPPKGVLGADIDMLPSILLPDYEHRQTASYGGRMRRKYGGELYPDSKTEKTPYRDLLSEQIREGGFAEAVRNEILEIKAKFGHKLDGALDQFLDCLAKYYAEHGVPGTKTRCP